MAKQRATVKNGIRSRASKNKDGTIRLDLKCDICGSDIRVSDPQFGFDCVNKCARKKYDSDPSIQQEEYDMKELIKTFTPK